MRMDPPSLIDEESYPSPNVPSYNLAEIWQLQMNGFVVVAESGVGLGESRAQFTPNLVRLEQVSAVNHGHSANVKVQGGPMKRREPDCDSISHLPSGNSPAANDNKKRLKTAGSREMSSYESKTEAKVQNSQPPKQDCIHVRARRGEATDSHSLAERARREKISVRMKILQDLVPGCSKVIRKAMVLDEIINYVQSLQSQVEFLSMKLEAVNSRVSPGIEVFPPKDTSPNSPCFACNFHEFCCFIRFKPRFSSLSS